MDEKMAVRSIDAHTHTREMEREKGRKKSDREIRDGEGGG